ncbi:MAG: response regulator [Nostoc sp. ChiQUE02]|uniref:response regulator n=1 Tax=Nostoc sp. ChiQUE02 TaxID=3075377 RepID=UPI002AD3DB5F|nr:response regulator [Nostoc sp. ChiQUE02]MDZ8231908.1 response regulator [Nostoc sp. ChiQUE02]
MAKESVIKRILVCDDVADNSFLLKTILQAEDCLIEIVDSGAAVLAYLETAPNPPDLLILDVVMPKMDGFEVVRHLLSSTKFQFIPILLVTSFDEDDAEKALDIKIDGFINKPIDPDIVTAKVQAILARNSENFPSNNNSI